jgi:hypothetical protein
MAQIAVSGGGVCDYVVENAAMNRAPTKDQALRQVPAETDGRVVPFRRPGALFARNAPPPPSLPDLGEYERARDEPDDYRHRMIMNAIAFFATVVMVVAGLWIADVIAKMRKDQDCVLMSRPNCAHLDIQSQQR